MEKSFTGQFHNAVEKIEFKGVSPRDITDSSGNIIELDTIFAREIINNVADGLKHSIIGRSKSNQGFVLQGYGANSNLKVLIRRTPFSKNIIDAKDAYGMGAHELRGSFKVDTLIKYSEKTKQLTPIPMGNFLYNGLSASEQLKVQVQEDMNTTIRASEIVNAHHKLDAGIVASGNTSDFILTTASLVADIDAHLDEVEDKAIGIQTTVSKYHYMIDAEKIVIEISPRVHQIWKKSTKYEKQIFPGGKDLVTGEGGTIRKIGEYRVVIDPMMPSGSKVRIRWTDTLITSTVLIDMWVYSEGQIKENSLTGRYINFSETVDLEFAFLYKDGGYAPLAAGTANATSTPTPNNPNGTTQLPLQQTKKTTEMGGASVEENIRDLQTQQNEEPKQSSLGGENSTTTQMEIQDDRNDLSISWPIFNYKTAKIPFKEIRKNRKGKEIKTSLTLTPEENELIQKRDQMLALLINKMRKMKLPENQIKVLNFRTKGELIQMGRTLFKK